MIGAKWQAVKKRIASTVTSADNARAMNITKPNRTSWGDFPDVLIQADESAVKQHRSYAAAKAGDIAAAKQLVSDVLNESEIARMKIMLGANKPLIAPVFAEERAGINRIPAVFAEVLGERLHLPVYDEIVQINKAGHTGASGYYRLAHPALFDGEIDQNTIYLLVDDFIGQGGTLANLKGYIESNGGCVVLATTLTGKTYSAILTPSIETITKLRRKHGAELEDWWRKTYGYGFDRLTASEARYLERSDNADTIRDHILAARS